MIVADIIRIACVLGAVALIVRTCWKRKWLDLLTVVPIAFLMFVFSLLLHPMCGNSDELVPVRDLAQQIRDVIPAASKEQAEVAIGGCGRR